VDEIIVRVHVLQWQKFNLLQVLQTTTFVNLETQTIILIEVDYIPETDSGMASSVRVAAVRVPSLPHGSVYSFLLLLQI
jgi:hypothetical protein